MGGGGGGGAPTGWGTEGTERGERETQTGKIMEERERDIEDREK